MSSVFYEFNVRFQKQFICISNIEQFSQMTKSVNSDEFPQSCHTLSPTNTHSSTVNLYQCSECLCCSGQCTQDIFRVLYSRNWNGSQDTA